MLQVVWEKSACLFIYEAIHTTGLFALRGLPERPGASEPWGGDAWLGGGGCCRPLTVPHEELVDEWWFPHLSSAGSTSCPTPSTSCPPPTPRVPPQHLVSPLLAPLGRAVAEELVLLPPLFGKQQAGASGLETQFWCPVKSRAESKRLMLPVVHGPTPRLGSQQLVTARGCPHGPESCSSPRCRCRAAWLCSDMLHPPSSTARLVQDAQLFAQPGTGCCALSHTPETATPPAWPPVAGTACPKGLVLLRGGSEHRDRPGERGLVGSG